ncbi:hypothetical protein [Denitromonas iodatirespirans]|uniref:Uncharacterized protein n=1 Tax=Denitromonas iodatirespirans TaxID=2795389 RepID=A0A944H7B4_DENI1|nr:hypothetical protein [Denitromonas iodatirespirans]MBT0961014.1 hypothetical protein [Denitromonas iodatirespirans]
MKRLFLVLAVLAWIAAASVALTRLWFAYPDIFPALPGPWVSYLLDAYGAQNAEDVADLEILIGLAVSIPVVTLMTVVGLWVVRRRP